MKIKLATLTLSLLLSACTTATAAVVHDPEHQKYSLWLDNLKTEMVEKGISQSTVDKVYYKTDYYHPAPEVVKIDRRQAEFVLTSPDYLNRIVHPLRIKKGQENYQKLYPLFSQIEKQYGVQAEYIVAFWGAETNFGTNYGNFPVIGSLTQLSYDKRRSNFFKKQLFQALKIIDNTDIEPERMVGSWAGAMGHFQFMPSTFNSYAVDHDGDHQIDIWHSFEDAAASAAAYLSAMGWNPEQPWGMEVSLPWNFDFNNSGRKHRKSVKEWKKLGVRTTNNHKLPLNDEWQASIILPEGRKGKAYLIMKNFRLIMKWNRSENYALAIGLLADYIKTGKKWKPVENAPATRLKTEDVTKIQAFINRIFGSHLSEDGMLGQKTKEEIKKIQDMAKLPADGYPDYRLLQKINNYNPEIGFAVPVPDRKLHKGKHRPLRKQKNNIQYQAK